MSTTSENQEDWLNTSDTFMQAMTGRDIGRAYALFSDEARDEIPRSELSRLTEGSPYALFDGYGSLELESWEMTYSFPATRFVELVYQIHYQNGYEGTLEAALVEDGSDWKILWFEVTVPPDKIDDYVGLEVDQ